MNGTFSLKKILLICLFGFFSLALFAEDYFVCIGSFRNKKNAFAFSDSLEKKEMHTCVAEFELESKPLFRVLFKEPFKTVKEASKFAKSLSKNPAVIEFKISGIWILGVKELVRAERDSVTYDATIDININVEVEKKSRASSMQFVPLKKEEPEPPDAEPEIAAPEEPEFSEEPETELPLIEEQDVFDAVPAEEAEPEAAIEEREPEADSEAETAAETDVSEAEISAPETEMPAPEPPAQDEPGEEVLSREVIPPVKTEPAIEPEEPELESEEELPVIEDAEVPESEPPSEPDPLDELPDDIPELEDIPEEADEEESEPEEPDAELETSPIPEPHEPVVEPEVPEPAVAAEQPAIEPEEQPREPEVPEVQEPPEPEEIEVLKSMPLGLDVLDADPDPDAVIRYKGIALCAGGTASMPGDGSKILKYAAGGELGLELTLPEFDIIPDSIDWGFSARFEYSFEFPSDNAEFESADAMYAFFGLWSRIPFTALGTWFAMQPEIAYGLAGEKTVSKNSGSKNDEIDFCHTVRASVGFRWIPRALPRLEIEASPFYSFVLHSDNQTLNQIGVRVGFVFHFGRVYLY